jgi:hypothetical protein
MKILTNLKQLRNIDKYNKDSAYIDTNVYTLCQDNPLIIISGDNEEIEHAFYDYPNIKFIGPNLTFPNKKLSVPKDLLDERLLSSNITLERKCFEIAYICKNKSCPYIKKLSSIGNLKIMGPIINVNTIYESISEYRIVPFYKLAKICFVTDFESALLALNTHGVCIGTPQVAEQCEYVISIDDINSRSELLNVFAEYGQTDYAEKLISVIQYTHKFSYKTFFENLSKGINNETGD